MRWLSAFTELSSSRVVKRASSAVLSASLHSVSSRALVLAPSSSWVFCSSSVREFTLASAPRSAAAFSPSSSLRRPTASAFLPSSASWEEVLAFIWSTLISSRRVVIANSARNWSLSAWISAMEIGAMASRRRCVSRTARACTIGMAPMTKRPAIRKPIPIYMIGSIMTHAPARPHALVGRARHHATRRVALPASARG